MWFKNLLIYRFTAPVHISAESLETALQQKVARACGSQEVTTYGFIPPIGKREQSPLTHSSQHFVLFAACKEERLLPGQFSANSTALVAQMVLAGMGIGLLTVHLARESGVPYLACGHHATERFGIQALATHLQTHCGLDCRFVDIPNPV